MQLSQAVSERRSTRGYLPTEVPRALLDQVFATAQKAPSWCNVQPWRVWLTSGPAKERLVCAIVAAAESGSPHPDIPFPTEYVPPYDGHRRGCGKALYEAMGVARDDHAGRQDAWMRNFRAFDAPHVAIVGVDRRLGTYGVLDVGCWLQTLLLAATSAGIASCAQAALAAYPSAVRSCLEVPDEIGILFGVALGYEDDRVAANACRTSRSAVVDNVTFIDA